MNWRNVKLIFLREARDQLRDRRTLFMVFALPLILYPLMGIGMVQMTVTFTEQTRTVLVLNADDLPPPPLIENNRFLPQYFDSPTDSEKLRAISDSAADRSQMSDAEKRFADEALKRLPQIEEIGRVAEELRRAEHSRNEADFQRLTAQLDKLRQDFGDWFDRAPVQVLIIVPRGMKQQMMDIDRRLSSGNRESASLDLPMHPLVLKNGADEKSTIAFRRVREAISAWEDRILVARLHDAGLPASLPTPVDPVTVDLARKEKLSATTWSKMFPALLVIMAVTGAFYPAIDLGAGEKERGTMETLLISPASRQEIVTGKFLTVMLFSISTALLNLASMGYTGKHMLSLRAGGHSPFGDLSLPTLPGIIWIVLLAIPLSALFSALSLAFAMFARSTKEGQYYLTPLLMVTMGLMMFSLNPAVELTPFYSILPVIGPALLLKELLQGSSANGVLPFYAVAVTASSVCYSLLALWWAIEQFKSEDVLFREAERFDARLWLRHLLREKEQLPSFSEALFCFVLLLILQFASFSVMSDQFQGPPNPAWTLKLMMIQLLATVATPALLMAVLLTKQPLKTLKLRGFHPKWLIAAIVLPIVMRPLAVELLHQLEWFFPDLPPGAERLMQAISTRGLPLWLPLVAFAVLPAICEELAFRGFILSGLQRTQRYRLAAVMSSVAFGIIHTIPQQVFNATLLGLVLAALALRSGSLIPGVIFHFLFNAVPVCIARLTPEEKVDWGVAQLTRSDTAELYTWPVLIACVAIALPLLFWLVNGPVARGWRDADACLIPNLDDASQLTAR